MPTRSRTLFFALLITIGLLISGCGTRFWGEGGTGMPARGGLSIPLGQSK